MDYFDDWFESEQNLDLDELSYGDPIPDPFDGDTAVDSSFEEDYFDNIDQYHQEDIIQYFKEAESDDLDTAMKTLGENEYEEEEVRLMRIQFLSEVGN